jgi:vacuolar iron transporter family protein
LVSFAVGALLPLLTITLGSTSNRVLITFVAVTCALALSGLLSARLGYAPMRTAVIRNVLGGLFAMAVTFGIGSMLGTAGVV